MTLHTPEAVRGEAPKYLLALATKATARGWSAQVRHGDDGWTLFLSARILTPEGSATAELLASWNSANRYAPKASLSMLNGVKRETRCGYRRIAAIMMDARLLDHASKTYGASAQGAAAPRRESEAAKHAARARAVSEAATEHAVPTTTFPTQPLTATQARVAELRQRNADPVTTEDLNGPLAEAMLREARSDANGSGLTQSVWPSTFLGGNFYGMGCTLVHAAAVTAESRGDWSPEAAYPGTQALASVLPRTYISSTLSALEVATEHATEHGETAMDADAFGRWFITGNYFGDLRGAYRDWQRAQSEVDR